MSHDVSPLDLRELAGLVERTLDAEPGRRDVYDIEPLLDRYVELAIVGDQLHTALLRANACHLHRRIAALPPPRARTRMMLERRIALTQILTERARTVADRIAAVRELLEYYCARAADPAIVCAPNDLVASGIETFDAAQAADLVIDEQPRGA